MTLSWQRRVRAALAPHGLTHVQFVLVAKLWWLERERRAGPSQAELAAQAGTDTMMTSQVLRKLEQRGLVARRPDPADSRARVVGLTSAGRSLLAAALADVEATDEAFFAVLADASEPFVTALRTLVSLD